MTHRSVAHTLPPDPRSVGEARRMVRHALRDAGAADLSDAAELAVSELVTNAVVHAGTDVVVQVWAAVDGVRVEITDQNTNRPLRKHWAPTAGTGRGLQLVEESVDRWDVVLGGDAKTVWFEIGRPEASDSRAAAASAETSAAGVVEVTLQRVPLLMHRAWQEHAATLLREFLLFALEDDPSVLDRHAQASDVLDLLLEQVPAPQLPDEPDRLMADAIEPGVSADQLVLHVPAESVSHFAVLDELLSRAIEHADAGDLLGPPTQPEIDEMRQWLCEQVAGQAAGTLEPAPWAARTDVRENLARGADLQAYQRELAATDEAVLATDEASIIVAVSDPVLELLGYDDATDLLGRRIIVVVPERFRQAHVAGTTLHATNGRDLLIGVDVEVPMLRADGTEVPVCLRVETLRLASDRRVFAARLRLG